MTLHKSTSNGRSRNVTPNTPKADNDDSALTCLVYLLQIFGDINSLLKSMQPSTAPQGRVSQPNPLGRHRRKPGSAIEPWVTRCLLTPMRHLAGSSLRSLLIGGCFSASVLSATPSHSTEVLLYKLETQCSRAGAASVNCTVEAINEGKSTLYRHSIGQTIETVRITDDPLTMSLWNPETKSWQSLRNASGRFSTNTVCFNDQDLCVVNPNYLNSVRQDNAAKMAGRDLVRVHFGSDGRIDASCYDAGCEVVKR